MDATAEGGFPSDRTRRSLNNFQLSLQECLTHQHCTSAASEFAPERAWAQLSQHVCRYVSISRLDKGPGRWSPLWAESTLVSSLSRLFCGQGQVIIYIYLLYRYLIWIGSDQEKTFGPTITSLVYKHLGPERYTLWDSKARGSRISFAGCLI